MLERKYQGVYQFYRGAQKQQAKGFQLVLLVDILQPTTTAKLFPSWFNDNAQATPELRPPGTAGGMCWLKLLKPLLPCRIHLTQAACAMQVPSKATAFASIADSIKNAATRIADNVRGAKEDLKEVCGLDSVALPQDHTSGGAVLQMSGEHDSFVPDGDKNPRINKEASKEAQPFPEDRG